MSDYKVDLKKFTITQIKDFIRQYNLIYAITNFKNLSKEELIKECSKHFDIDKDGFIHVKKPVKYISSNEFDKNAHLVGKTVSKTKKHALIKMRGNLRAKKLLIEDEIKGIKQEMSNYPSQKESLVDGLDKLKGKLQTVKSKLSNLSKVIKTIQDEPERDIVEEVFEFTEKEKTANLKDKEFDKEIEKIMAKAKTKPKAKSQRNIIKDEPERDIVEEVFEFTEKEKTANLKDKEFDKEMEKIMAKAKTKPKAKSQRNIIKEVQEFTEKEKKANLKDKEFDKEIEKIMAKAKTKPKAKSQRNIIKEVQEFTEKEKKANLKDKEFDKEIEKIMAKAKTKPKSKSKSKEITHDESEEDKFYRNTFLLDIQNSIHAFIFGLDNSLGIAESQRISEIIRPKIRAYANSLNIDDLEHLRKKVMKDPSFLSQIIDMSEFKLGQYKGGDLTDYINVRQDFSPTDKKVLNKYGNYSIDKLVVVRTPINKAIDTAINVLSLGKFKKNVKGDEIYHLYLLIYLKGINTPLLFEKNDTPRLTTTVPSETEKTQKMEVNNVSNLTLNQFINNAIRLQGAKFWKYSFNTLNCQQQINASLKASNLLTPELTSFIMQDVTQATKTLNPLIQKGFQAVTDISAIGRRILGLGIYEDIN